MNSFTGSQSQMEANDPQNGWIPYMTSKDCTQGICSLYCPQWCYLPLPPPPPDLLGDDNVGVDPPSALSLSPLIIAIIGVLASAFLLVTYYTVISKFCRTSDSNADDIPREANNTTAADSASDPWYVSNATGGLDEALIKTITLCKYRKESGMAEGTCSVCLSEFQDDESIRLLPKCAHAFHVTCIDTWLKSHSNCPLCRSEVTFADSFPVIMPQPTPVVQSPRNENRQQHVTDSPTASSGNTRDHEEATVLRNRPSKSKSVRIGSGSHRDSIVPTASLVINVVEELQPIRRSFSTGHSCPTVADILKEDEEEQNQHIQGEMESASVSTATNPNDHENAASVNYTSLDIGHKSSFLQHYSMDDRPPRARGM